MTKHIIKFKRLALRALTLALAIVAVLQAFIYYDGVWHLVG
jgi:hypothetical protein